jgi:hypothetical protein
MTSATSGTAPETVELGPVDILVLGFPAGAPMTGEAVPLLMDLVERGIVRVLDVLFVTKDENGEVAGFDAQGLGPERIGDFQVFDGATSGLIGGDDLVQAGNALEPGESAVMIVYENTWAAPFVAAVRRNGGIVLANDRIPVQTLMEALEAAGPAA